jgi:hypothetical protein
MRCKKAELLISMRVDGEPIPADESARLEAHLENCSSCRAVHSRETERAALLDLALAGAPGGRGLEETLLEAARRPARQGRPERGWTGYGFFPAALVPLAVGLAAGVLVAGGWWWWSTDGAQRDRPVKILVEESSRKSDVVPTDFGPPVGRDVLTSRYIIYDRNIPDSDIPDKDGSGREPKKRARGGERSPQLIFDGERVDTRYYRLASNPYR